MLIMETQALKKNIRENLETRLEFALNRGDISILIGSVESLILTQWAKQYCKNVFIMSELTLF